MKLTQLVRRPKLAQNFTISKRAGMHVKVGHPCRYVRNLLSCQSSLADEDSGDPERASRRQRKDNVRSRVDIRGGMHVGRRRSLC